MGNTYGEIAQRPVLVVAEQPPRMPDPRSIRERADRFWARSSAGQFAGQKTLMTTGLLPTLASPTLTERPAEQRPLPLPKLGL
jgi:hypothetical protein